MENRLQTPSQTIGPYFAYGLCPEQYLYDFKSLVGNEWVDTSAERTYKKVTIIGRVYDGAGIQIPDAMIEIWQNDGKNKWFGRCGTGADAESRFVFHTRKPEPLEGQAPFLTLIVFMRGQLIHSFTRVYFSDEAALNEKDEVLNAVDPIRRHTLIAQKNGDSYTFNIYMQGAHETVFFEV